MDLPAAHSTPDTPPWVLFSLFQIQKRHAFWAFQTMGRAEKMLRNSRQMSFGLMLGTGGGSGFGLMPNWHQYALLSCWPTASDAKEFLSAAPLVQQLQTHSQEHWSVLMQPVVAKGAWGGKNPFLPLASSFQAHEPVLVLTRASINFSRLYDFWKHIPAVSRSTEQAPGLLMKTGIGELPLVQQATLSLWENEQSINNFAYKMQQHKKVVSRTRQRNWYSEELFARFRPVESKGTLGGINPLEKLIKPAP